MEKQIVNLSPVNYIVNLFSIIARIFYCSNMFLLTYATEREANKASFA
jgi:hypothetical protein